MKILIIGPGKKFLGGISYYTLCLANALVKNNEVSVILHRNLLPSFLFPGSIRVGKKITNLEFSNKVEVFDGLDWYVIPSIIKAINFIKRRNPDVIILQWWTSTCLHNYLILNLINKIFLKKKIIIEFHETLDPFEDKFILLRLYSKLGSLILFKNQTAYFTHSKNDLNLLIAKYKLKREKFYIVQHGSYHNYPIYKRKGDKKICNFLFFGLIRPYKGIDYLIKAFEKIPKKDIHKFHLTIVGETWEKFDIVADLIEKSMYRNNITFVNKYVTDEMAGKYFSDADIVVLPYRRASQSGAAHIAMYYGLPIISSDVGGLRESLEKYEGTRFFRNGDISALSKLLKSSFKFKGRRFKDPYPWKVTSKEYNLILRKIIAEKGR